ncbi:roadblock/LC7 domain-containing protein [Gemmatimonas sp.]|jgi:predicted regulator of Ras-like GTPase activity (Roadblock/LC7/MglB family)|uniref:roadblock/LC7 domain-containing protein n=1 Tax=Gemmatimonas sp. TaxID=1962908 RepID=UPI0037C1A968
MPTIRDLVSALRRRDGVDAAVVLGRDGLLIDGSSATPLDPESVAAFVPPMALAAADLGLAAQRGDFGLLVLEYDAGSAVVSALSHDVYLLVLLQPTANLAGLLYDLRRYRTQLSALV